jgi:uncharacterized protein
MPKSCFRGEKMSQQIERRTVSNEVKAADAKHLIGLAARYNSRTKIGNEFFEQILPGAFRSCIQRDPIPLLVNHDVSLLISRSPGTLTLRETQEGLAFSADLPDTELARSTAAHVQRNDLQGMSFSFQLAPGDDVWTQETDPETGEKIPVRSIKNFSRVWDISVCTNPQYEGVTNVSARALLEARSISSRSVLSEKERLRLLDDARRKRLEWTAKEIRKDAASSDDDTEDDDPDDFDPTGFVCARCGSGNLRCADCGEPVQKTDDTDDED